MHVEGSWDPWNSEFPHVCNHCEYEHLQVFHGSACSIYVHLLTSTKIDKNHVQTTGARHSHTLEALERSADLTWPGLAEALDVWNCGYTFDRRTKATIRADTRSGFRVWIRQTVGSVPLATAWVRYGFCTRARVRRWRYVSSSATLRTQSLRRL